MESGLWNLFDLVLALLLLGLAWAAISSPSLKRGVVLFIAFGLLLALVWARLLAPDLALAEAAIGAGMTGALLLTALRDEPPLKDRTRTLIIRPLTGWVCLLAVLLTGVVGWALLQALARGDSIRLAGKVSAHLAESGVSNPVTAVLLNFRAYDTLLELAVLLAAVLGILALNPARPGYRAAGPLFAGLIRWLVPLLMVTAGYLLWVGAHAPGGAFQAGATLAAAAVLLRLGGHAGAGLPGPRGQRWILAGGLGVFLTVGLLMTMRGAAFLEYPAAWAGSLILAIEIAATLAIATTLTVAYLGGRPTEWSSESAMTADVAREEVA